MGKRHEPVNRNVSERFGQQMTGKLRLTWAMIIWQRQSHASGMSMLIQVCKMATDADIARIPYTQRGYLSVAIEFFAK